MSSVTHILPHFYRTDALETHEGKVSIGCRNIISLRFADELDAPAEEE